jgi:site-specific recombinase XerD
MRNSFATRLRDHGVDLQIIQEGFGHAQITTAMYAQITTAMYAQITTAMYAQITTAMYAQITTAMYAQITTAMYARLTTSKRRQDLSRGCSRDRGGVTE